MQSHRHGRGPRPASLARVPGIDYDLLDSLAGYALRRAQIAVFDGFFRVTAGSGITPPRFTALVILGANPGLTQTRLGAVLGIARSGAMFITDWLEQRGLARRRRHSEDGRVWGLYLTRRGTALLARLKKRVLAQDRRFTARLTARERRELLRLLKKVTERR